MGNSAFIRFVKTGQVIPLEIATATSEGREQYLKPFTGSATVECLCVDPPVPMTVAHRRVGVETWYLCPASATTKHLHAEWCPLQINSGSAQTDTLEAPPAVVVEENQTIIRGGFKTAWQEARPGAIEKSDNHDGIEKRTTRESPMTLFMWALWSQSELNVWKPAFRGKRFYGQLRWRLLSGTKKITLFDNRNKPISPDEYFHIPPAWSAKDPARKAECAKFESMLRAKLCAHKIIVLAGQLRKFEDTDDAGGHMLYLAHFRHGLWLPPGLSQKLEKSVQQWAGGIAGKEGDNRFVFAEIRAKSMPILGGTMPDIECIDCSIGRFSKDWIPVDSQHEQRICDQMVAEDREFVKPFTKANRKDWISGLCNKLGVTPDFVLTDRKPAVFMEVLGRMKDDASYRARTAAKMGIYRETQRPVWVWDTSQLSDPPMLP